MVTPATIFGQFRKKYLVISEKIFIYSGKIYCVQARALLDPSDLALLLFYLEQYRARQLTVETLVTRQAAAGQILLIC